EPGEVAGTRVAGRTLNDVAQAREQTGPSGQPPFVVLRAWALAGEVGEDLPHMSLAEVEAEATIEQRAGDLARLDRPPDLGFSHFQALCEQGCHQIMQAHAEPPQTTMATRMTPHGHILAP